MPGPPLIKLITGGGAWTGDPGGVGADGRAASAAYLLAAGGGALIVCT